MTEKFERTLCCLVFLKDLLLLWGKIVLAIITCIFGSIFPKSKKPLKDEIVLITGAGRGLGKELSRKFAALDTIVVLWDINETSIRELRAEIITDGGRAHAYVCDVSDWDCVQRVGRKVQEDVGDVTILVNNAGILQNQRFLELDTAKIKQTFEVNIIAHFWTIRFFLPRMFELDKGHILAVSSMAGFVGCLYMADYCATKFGIFGMMEALEEEIRLMGKSDLVHCTTVCPVTMDTGMNNHPTSRFPWLMPILNTELTAADIVIAVQRNERLVTIPKRVFFPFLIQRCFPRKVTQLVMDFLQYNMLTNDRENRANRETTENNETSCSIQE